MSFFPLKDSTGTTQLILDRSEADADPALQTLRDVPVESSVIVEGIVQLRPEDARRSVSIHFFGGMVFMFIDPPS